MNTLIITNDNIDRYFPNNIPDDITELICNDIELTFLFIFIYLHF